MIPIPVAKRGNGMTDDGKVIYRTGKSKCLCFPEQNVAVSWCELFLGGLAFYLKVGYHWTMNQVKYLEITKKWLYLFMPDMSCFFQYDLEL